MKKIIAVFMVLTIVLAFAGCKGKEYQDTVVTIPVTDENGEPVTDKDGKVVTEVSTDAQDSTKKNDGKDETKPSSTTADGKDETTKKNNSATAKDETTKKNSGGTTAKADNTTTSTTKATTKPTEAPTKSKKRNIHLVINFPTYIPGDSEMIVKYRVDGGKFEELKREKVTFGEPFTKEYDLKNVKGAVDFVITVDGPDITNNKFTVEASDKDQTHEVTLVTGIEVVEGGWD